jgi:predicted lipid-binding transport protein (Tim44 family)
MYEFTFPHLRASMGDTASYLDIILLAAIAGFVLLRLRSVLGRRTGHERPGQDHAAGETFGKPAAPPAGEPSAARRGRNEPAGGAKSTERPRPITPLDTPLADALSRIGIADRAFEPDSFLEGARDAYALIVEAFAEGREEALKPLLGDDVFAGFAEAIAERKAKGLSEKASVVRIVKAAIWEAELEGGVAEVSVRFESDIVRVTLDAENRVVAGDPSEPARVVDIWTFARVVKSSDPNWKLVATASES